MKPLPVLTRALSTSSRSYSRRSKGGIAFTSTRNLLRHLAELSHASGTAIPPASSRKFFNWTAPKGRNDPQVPGFEGIGPEDAEERVPSNSNFELPTVNYFLAAAVSGVMPGGEKTAMPLFPKEDMVHFSTKYVDWAPEPFSKLPPQATAFGSVPGDSPAPIIRIMQIMSGLDDIFNMTMKPATIERSFKSMKSKVWCGIVPVSDARWRTKGLDKQDNIEEALATIQQVVDVFEYLRRPEIQGKLRDTYNKIWAEIDIFQDAINALYRARGDPAPEWSLSKLWQEYTKSHFLFMEQQARAWVFKRLLFLHTMWKARFMEVVQSGRQISETQATIKIDHFVMMILNKILDVYIEADLCIRARMDGFHMAHGIDRRLAGAVTGEKTPKQLNKIYSEMEKKRVSDMRLIIKGVVAQREAQLRQGDPIPAFMAPVNLMINREFGHKGLQPEFENPLSLKMESWVQNVSGEQTEKFGFVVYRISYKDPNEQWIEFLAKLEAGLDSGWEGVVGAEAVKAKATLEWIDGREHNIAGGDMDGVRKHFQTVSKSKAFFPDISRQICLAITDESVNSFSNQPGKLEGDSRGFIYAIDADFDPAKVHEKKPDYDGTFKITDQLVWTDLYALGVNRTCQSFEEFWALAAEHPSAVYVGPTTGVRRREWRKMREGVEALDEKSTAGSGAPEL